MIYYKRISWQHIPVDFLFVFTMQHLGIILLSLVIATSRRLTLARSFFLFGDKSIFDKIFYVQVQQSGSYMLHDDFPLIHQDNPNIQLRLMMVIQYNWHK